MTTLHFLVGALASLTTADAPNASPEPVPLASAQEADDKQPLSLVPS